MTVAVCPCKKPSRATTVLIAALTVAIVTSACLAMRLTSTQLAVQRCVQATVAEAVAEEREVCEERVEDLYEKIETPYLVDIALAIHACDKA